MSSNRRKRYRLGARFAEPFGSRLWHADGTPFTDAEYRAAGFDPPTPEQLAEFARRDRGGLCQSDD
jgi:hypothetical protein